MNKKIAITIICLSMPVILMFIFIMISIFTRPQVVSEKPKIDIVQLDYKQCTLRANQEYTDKIKLFGTRLTVNGKSYDSLSKEQWEQLNNDRLKQIEYCSRV